MAYDPEYFRAYYRKNRAKKLAQVKAWRAANPELVKAYHRRSREKGTERAWRVKNRTKVLSSKRKYRSTRRAELVKKAVEWGKSHPQRRREICRKHRAKSADSQVVFLASALAAKLKGASS